MRWRQSIAKGSVTDYIGDAGSMPVNEAVRELWRKYIDDGAPINTDVGWDHLRVETWLDSGRIILFPAARLASAIHALCALTHIRKAAHKDGRLRYRWRP